MTGDVAELLKAAGRRSISGVSDHEIQPSVLDQLFVTLCYLHLPPREVLARVAGFRLGGEVEPFSFSFGRSARWPSTGLTLSVGVSIKDGRQQVVELRKTLRAELAALGIRVPRDAFRPWVTVSRFKPGVPDWWGYPNLSGDPVVGAHAIADAFVLMASTEDRGYVIWDTWRLRGRTET